MYIGVDLGGTNIAVGIVDSNGKILKKSQILTNRDRGFEAVTDDIIFMIKKMIDDEVKEPNLIKGVGVGIPGVIDPKTNRVISCVNLFWNNEPLGEKLQGELNIPTFIANDATLAGLAEYKLGTLKNIDNAVLLTIGTGIGASVILNGKIVSGTHGIGSEVGHMVVGDGDDHCNCGRIGCLETYASANAIIRYVKKNLVDYPESLIHDRIDGDINKIDGALIFELAKMGDKICYCAVKRCAMYLSIGIMNIISVIDPELIALGGGVSNAGNFLLELVREELQTEKYFKDSPIADICIASLKNDAGILGSALFAQEALNN